MKNKLLRILPVIILLFGITTNSYAQENQEKKSCCPTAENKILTSEDLLKLNHFPQGESYAQISDIQPLKIGDQLKDKIKSKFVFYVTQPIDHKNPSLGDFKQMVVVAFAGWDRPNVLITEGYTGKYGLNPNYYEEIARLLNCNYIVVEHRYFNNSVPFKQKDSTISWADLNWDYMTAEQEAADLHNIRLQMGRIFSGKWVATGISKGGENCMAYTSFYPNDVDCSVPYVGPVAFAQEDSRPQPFIRDSVGTPKDREIILNFQKEILKRRDKMEPLLEEFSKKKNIVYNISIPEVLDYCVLEFSFAFWQWGYPTSIIPNIETTSDEELFKFFANSVGPDYFQSWDDNAPFFVQAAKELGYYPYDTEPFKGLLKVKSTEGYLRKIFLPGGREFKFDETLSKRITNFIATTDSKMIFIYGEWDPWSSVRPLSPGNDNIKFYIAPGGSHRARISNLPQPMKEEAIKLLKEWLAVE